MGDHLHYGCQDRGLLAAHVARHIGAALRPMPVRIQGFGWVFNTEVEGGKN